MSSNKNKLKSLRESQRSYLNRDFNSFRSNLTQYARTFFSDKISDFSENGFAGMMIELNAYVGDVMSYYIDHQFQELDLMEATETKNIERLIRNTGVKIEGASPATVDVEFYMEVPSTISKGKYIPNSNLMPVIKSGTKLSASTGTTFTLVEDIDMGEKFPDGSFKCKYVTMKTDNSGNPTSFSIMRFGLCVSSVTSTETFTIPNQFLPFRTIDLKKSNVNEVISVKDSDGNEYFEVDNLTQDTVFKRVANNLIDSEEAPESIELIPAPRRFVLSTSTITRKTTLRFGGGTSLSTDDDIMPDPSDLSIPLYGKRKTLKNFTLDPNKLLSTTTLGVTPQNTTITVVYRHGGGLDHNVSAGAIRSVSSLLTKFKNSVSSTNLSAIRSSLEVINREPAAGGENSPTINEMRGIAIAQRNSQMRIVTKEDLIARIYSMPNKFGRVFRAGIRSNPNNPLASMVSIISRDSKGNLTISPDTLKENLRVFLNQSRLVSDAVDIVDAAVINIGVSYGISVSGNANPDSVIQKVNDNLKQYFKIENFQIEQPIVMTDVVNIIINTQDVVSLVYLDFLNKIGEFQGNYYSDVSTSIPDNTKKGILLCPAGSIFEVKFPDDDIVGTQR
jgi:hypothetical protein